MYRPAASKLLEPDYHVVQRCWIMTISEETERAASALITLVPSYREAAFGVALMA